MTPPPPHAVARFRADLAALGIGEDERLGVAVSGGADSLALLLLASAVANPRTAATVDHRLRAASTSEAEYVHAACDRLDMTHAILPLPRHERGNVSDWARRERYAALERWADGQGVSRILTAHHADDQLETVIMRLNRGAGVGGLAGVRRVNGRLARPLLGWRKADLVAIVAGCGIEPIDDPTNRDHRYDRARLRAALADADWLDRQAVAHSARLLGEAEEALDWVAQRMAHDGRRDRRPRTSVPVNLPQELARRLTLLAIKAIDPACEPAGEALNRLMRSLGEGKIATIGSVLCASDGKQWTFAPAPPRRPTRRRAEPASN